VFLTESYGQDGSGIDGVSTYWYPNLYKAMTEGIMNVPFGNIRVIEAEVNVNPQLGRVTNEIVNVLNNGLGEMYKDVRLELDGPAFYRAKAAVRSLVKGIMPKDGIYSATFRYLPDDGLGRLVNPTYGFLDIWGTSRVPGSSTMKVKLISSSSIIMHGVVNMTTGMAEISAYRVYRRAVIDYVMFNDVREN